MTHNELVETLQREIHDAGARGRVVNALNLTKTVRTREAIRVSVAMLGSGRSRADIAAALRARFGVSRATSYRWLSIALDQRLRPTQ